MAAKKNEPIHEPTRRLRLLKLMVQPVYVLDDGEKLSEHPGEVFTLTEADIDGFPAAWAETFAAIRSNIESPPTT